MEKLNRRNRRRLARVLLLGLASWLVAEAARAPRPPARVKSNGRDGAPERSPHAPPERFERPPVARVRRSLTAFGFALLFFAGASLTAVAGDRVGSYLEDDAIVLAHDETTEDAEPTTESAPAEEEPAAPVQEAPATVEEAPTEPDALPEVSLEAEPVPDRAADAVTPVAIEEPEPAAAEEDAAAATAGGRTAAAAPTGGAKAPASRSRAAGRPRPEPRAPAVPAVEAGGHAHTGLATVWLDRTLTDPTPRSLRLTPRFARRLRAVSRREGVHWSLVLATLRADGNRRPVPARAPTLARTARQLAAHNAERDAWAAVLAIGGRTAYADRAVALAQYYRAIGLRALVRGLRAEQGRLVRRLLADEGVVVYAGGRADLAAGRVDVRVVALVAYLRQAFGQVTVSSLISGHRIYSRPGVVSAHVYGAAVDIAVLGGVPVLGNQGRGSLTERAVREILLLPAEMLPRQVISLLGLGGPSFPLADHHDHIHVGY